MLRDPVVVAAVAGFVAGAEAGTAEDACAHGRSARLSGCEACLLEHELFVPARRRQAGPALAQR